MSVFDFLFMALPVVFLIASVLIAVKAVSRGKSRKRTLMMQLASFAAVFAICMVCPFVASAASETVEVAQQGSFGMAYIGAAAATGLSRRRYRALRHADFHYDSFQDWLSDGT